MSKYGLDTFVSQGLSEVTSPALLPIRSLYPQSKFWVTNYILNSTLGHPTSNEVKSFGLIVLRRAESSFVEYDMAINVAGSITEEGKATPSNYFRLLHHLEVTISLAYQAYQFLMKQPDGKKDIKLFDKHDDTPLSRMNRIYNFSRHFNPFELPEDHLHKIWLTNNSIEMVNHNLKFDELTELLRELFSVADSISSFKK